MIIEGFATTPLQDVYGDIIVPEAFEDLSSFLRHPELRHAHGKDQCSDVGRIIELQLTDSGLFIRAQVFQERRDIADEILSGKLLAFSIGFKCLEYGPDPVTGIRTLKRLRLREISLTRHPANAGTAFKVCEGVASADIRNPKFRPKLSWSIDRIERAARKLIEECDGKKSAFKLNGELNQLRELVPFGHDSQVLCEAGKLIERLSDEAGRKWADYLFSLPLENVKAA